MPLEERLHGSEHMCRPGVAASLTSVEVMEEILHQTEAVKLLEDVKTIAGRAECTAPAVVAGTLMRGFIMRG